MRSKLKRIGDEKQMNLFGWVDEPSYKPAGSINRPDTLHENGVPELSPNVKAHANISQEVLDYPLTLRDSTISEISVWTAITKNASDRCRL
jgi:hypothetical protein